MFSRARGFCHGERNGFRVSARRVFPEVEGGLRRHSWPARRGRVPGTFVSIAWDGRCRLKGSRRSVDRNPWRAPLPVFWSPTRPVRLGRTRVELREVCLFAANGVAARTGNLVQADGRRSLGRPTPARMRQRRVTRGTAAMVSAGLEQGGECAAKPRAIVATVEPRRRRWGSPSRVATGTARNCSRPRCVRIRAAR